MSVSVDTNTSVKKGQVLAQLDTRKTVIRAPIDGIVLARHVEVGLTVALGTSGPSPSLFTIASDLAKLEIHAPVAPEVAPRLAIGMKPTFTVKGYPEVVFPGIVRRIRMDSSPCDVVIDVDNADLGLRPGMEVSVTFPLDGAAGPRREAPR